MASAQTLGALMMDALTVRAQMRQDGASQSECDAVIEELLRAKLPFAREWKYLCQTCRDCGLEMLACPGDATCGREKPHLAHDYGRPCWCSLGRRFQPKPPSDDETSSRPTGRRR